MGVNLKDLTTTENKSIHNENNRMETSTSSKRSNSSLKKQNKSVEIDNYYDRKYNPGSFKITGVYDAMLDSSKNLSVLDKVRETKNTSRTNPKHTTRVFDLSKTTPARHYDLLMNRSRMIKEQIEAEKKSIKNIYTRGIFENPNIVQGRGIYGADKHSKLNSAKTNNNIIPSNSNSSFEVEDSVLPQINRERQSQGTSARKDTRLKSTKKYRQNFEDYYLPDKNKFGSSRYYNRNNPGNDSSRDIEYHLDKESREQSGDCSSRQALENANKNYNLNNVSEHSHEDSFERYGTEDSVYVEHKLQDHRKKCIDKIVNFSDAELLAPIPSNR